MRRLLSGWDALDPSLVRLLRINLIALVVSTASSGRRTSWASGTPRWRSTSR